MTIQPEARENQLLRSLSKSEFTQLAPHLELITLFRSEVLFEANNKLQYIYFPITATASLLCSLEDGTTVEVACVGKEGLIGISAILGCNETMTQAIVNLEGSAYRISLK